MSILLLLFSLLLRTYSLSGSLPCVLLTRLLCARRRTRRARHARRVSFPPFRRSDALALHHRRQWYILYSSIFQLLYYLFTNFETATQLSLVKDALYILTSIGQIFASNDVLPLSNSNNEVSTLPTRVLTSMRPREIVMGTHHSLALQADPIPSLAEITPSTRY